MLARRWQLNRLVSQGNLRDAFRSVRACLLFAQLGSCTLAGDLDIKRGAYLTSPQGIKELVRAVRTTVMFGAHQQLNLWVAPFTEQLVEVGLSIHDTNLAVQGHLCGQCVALAQALYPAEVLPLFDGFLA